MRVCDMGGGVSSSGVPAPLVGIGKSTRRCKRG